MNKSILNKGWFYKTGLNYVKIFFLAFFAFALCVGPTLLFTDGIWIYYGDFNVQQIPFYYHVHEAVRNGNFLYDWSTDLGGSLVGCYSFYLLGSPFFWITLPFPTESIPYLMPWISALKYAVMATTAFAYLKRHTKTESGAIVGALLYTFSGFQGAVLVYNHFHDVMAFFPLYLIVFERMLEKKKRFAFILMTAFMVILNYYFFVGEAVFLVIYFVTMYCFEPGTAKEKLLLLVRAGISGVAGVLLSGIYILPAVYYTMNNSRVSDTLMGYDLVAYSEPTMLWNIIKSLVMLPDVSGLNSALNMSYSRVSGIGAYIPLFSIAGVIAFFIYNKGKVKEKRLLVTCAVFAAIPMLNALFSALNNEYYARWYYMPVLIMALMTASVLEEPAALPSLKKGARANFFITMALFLIFVLPAKTEDGNLTVIGALKNSEQLISETIFTAFMLVCLCLYLAKLANKGIRVTGIVVYAACIITTATMMITGCILIDSDRKHGYIDQVLTAESPLPKDGGEFYRIETEEDVFNYPMFWEGHSITSFISTIPNSTIDFYASQGIKRKVTSNIWVARLGARTLLSAKYFLNEVGTAIEYIGRVDDMSDLRQYELWGCFNGFEFYKNTCYVPMGFSFNEYITESEYEETDATAQTKDRLLLKFLILPDEAAQEYGYLMEHDPKESYTMMSLNEFSKECDKRRATACDTFETSTYGFTATVNMEKENLLFFSVPYEEGFTAYVDGKETKIVKADYGFMAICVPEGRHAIEFKYIPSYYKYGLYLSIAGLFLLVALAIYDLVMHFHKTTEIEGISENNS